MCYHEGMSNRPNQYPGTCTRCGEHVAPQTGVVYKDYPFTGKQPWRTRCGDEQACSTRVADAASVESNRRNERHLASAEHVKAIETASRYDVPKTLTIALDGYTHKITRRTTTRGVSVKQSYVYDGEVESDSPATFPTEADAVAYTIDQITDLRWLTVCKVAREAYKSVLESLRVGGA
jgi:hypothetical protein